jgi:hypothetical protein
MARKSRISDETIAEWDREREEFAELMRLRDERLARHAAAVAAWEARRTARRALLRRWSLGLLGREPTVG